MASIIVCDLCGEPGQEIPNAKFDLCGRCALTILGQLWEREAELMADVMEKAKKIEPSAFGQLMPQKKSEPAAGSGEVQVKEPEEKVDLSRHIVNPVKRRLAELHREHGGDVFPVVLPDDTVPGSQHSYGHPSNPQRIQVLERVPGIAGQWFAKIIRGTA